MKQAIQLLLIVASFFFTISSQAAVVTATSSGKWSQGNNWSTGNTPSSTDDVIINSGSSIWLDGSITCKSLIINGEVYFKNHNESLVVTGDVTINSGGSFDLQSNGNGKTQTLSIGGSLTNNGTFDLSNGSSLYCALTFTGSAAATWTMNGGSVNDVALNGVTINKGSSISSVLTGVFNGGFTIDGTSNSSFLVLQNGLLDMSGNSVMNNPVFAGGSTIPATSGLRISNNNLTVSGQSGSLTNNGLLQVSGGTFNAGSAAGDQLTGTGKFTVDGGTLNVASQLSSTSGTFQLSSGTVNVCTAGNSTIGTPSFDLGAASTFSMTGGVMNLVQPNSALLTPLDYRVSSGTITASGGTLNVGTSATTTNYSFRISGAVPTIVVDNTTNNKTAVLSAAATSYGSVTVSNGATLNTSGFTLTARGTAFNNYGTLSGNGTVSFSGSSAQTYTGSNSIAASLTVANATGLTLNSGITFSTGNALTVAAGALLDAQSNQFNFGTLGTATINGTLYTSNSAGFSGSASTTISSTNNPTITLGSSSTVVYNSGSSQTVTARAYANLNITAAGVKTLAGNASIGNSNTLTVAASSTLSAANNTISFGTAASASILGGFRTSNSAGFSGSTATAISSTNNPTITLGSASTIQYNGTASQAITARTDYANLTISGSRSAGSTITLGSGTIGLTGTLSATATNATYASTGNTVNYKGSGEVVAAFAYNNLSLTGASGTTFPSGTVNISGSFTPASISAASQGTINFKGSGQTVPAFSYYNLDLTGASSLAFASGTVAVAGTFTPATTSSASQGTISFNGGSQTVPAFSFNNLALSSGTKSMSGAVSVGGNVTLTGSSRLTLGAYSISIAGTATGDASNYIVTDGAGSVVLRAVTATGKQFPIGATTSSYSPLTVAQASSLDWTVRVSTGIIASAVNASSAIQRTWTITPSTNPTLSGSTLTFQYNEGDAGIQGANWSTSSAVALSRYNGSVWNTAAGGITPTGTAGSIRTVTASGLTAFSSWVVAKGSAPLPVQLLSFNGLRRNSTNTLQWRTATESNNAGFALERSEDGQQFSQIAFVASQATGGNSTSMLAYQFNDVTISARTYFYRLRQQDINGRYTYSSVVRLQASALSGTAMNLYPNPATVALQVSVSMESAAAAHMRLLDAQGRTLQQQSVRLDAGTTVLPLSLSALTPGAYFVQLSFEDGSSITQRFVRQ